MDGLEKAIYNIDYTKKYKVKRRIEIKDVDEGKMSKLADDFFAICVPSEYDYLLVSAKKTEIALKIYEAKEALTNETLKLSFSNWYEIDMY